MPFVKGQVANPQGLGGVKPRFKEAMKVYRLPPVLGDRLRDLLKSGGEERLERIMEALEEVDREPGKSAA